MLDDDLIEQFAQPARQERPRHMDVTATVMRSIHEREALPTVEFERQLRLDAVVAVIVALLISIPAQYALQTLLNPMISLFGSIEAALQ